MTISKEIRSEIGRGGTPHPHFVESFGSLTSAKLAVLIWVAESYLFCANYLIAPLEFIPNTSPYSLVYCWMPDHENQEW